MMNRLANCHNQYQGSYPRVLCVCSAGLLRSPSIAGYLYSPPFNCNTRAAGATKEYALIPVDEVLLDWADHVVFANRDNMLAVQGEFGEREPGTVWCLDLPDQYAYRDPELMEAIAVAVKKCGLAAVLLGTKTGDGISVTPVSAKANPKARRARR